MMPKVSPVELTSLAKYVEKVSGIVLDRSKAYLIESRLGPILNKMGYNTYSELQRKAEMDATGKTRIEIINGITTNETSFFRDKHPFELLNHKLVPDFFERAGIPQKMPLRILSAACSTGQEAYSVAITLKQMLHTLTKYQIRILGVDISDAALKYASMGRFTRHELSRGISADYLSRFFVKQGDVWRISDELRSIAYFQKANLLEPVRGLGQFDIVFCRNVAIYFSLENRKKLFESLGRLLTPQGVLIIGSTESLVGVTRMFVKKEFRGKVYYELSQ
ncbi:MAG: protein-glutamate O-methyltransferase CheR [Planctomycetota bacterium]